VLPGLYWGSTEHNVSPVSPHTRCSTKCQSTTWRRRAASTTVPRRRWPNVYQGDAPTSRPTSTHSQGSALVLYGQRAARRNTACRCDRHGAARQKPSRGHTLGCAGHYRASAHTAPRRVRPAQPASIQRRDTRRRGDTQGVPCKDIHSSTAGSHTRSSHGDGGAQGHEWPRSSIPSRCDKSVARRVAHRQGIHGDASRHRWSITGKRPRGREGEDGHGVLTSGRRCSRDRLGVEVHVGEVGVHGGGATSVLASCTRTALPLGTTASVLAASAPIHGRPPVLSARRGGGAPSFSLLLPLLLLSFLSQWQNRGMGKTPMRLVGGQQGLGLGV
jgi:hypothetical protein